MSRGDAKRIRLTKREIEALRTAAGAADPACFEEHGKDDAYVDRMNDAVATAREKLAQMLDRYKVKKS